MAGMSTAASPHQPTPETGPRTDLAGHAGTGPLASSPPSPSQVPAPAAAARLRGFRQVDVFTDQAGRGNPLAVVLDGEDLSTEAMQAFADWTNLSEATFVLPPTAAARVAGAHYRLRIFCPGRELPFAGHPTLGSCHAWLAAGGAAGLAPGQDVLQECGVGLVRVRRWPDGTLAFAAPPLRRSGPLPEDELARLLEGLGLARDEVQAHAWCDNGPPWRGLLLRSAERVLSLQPDAARLAGLDIGVAGPTGQADPAFEVRAFFSPRQGLAEDPVTGSLNAAMAQWLIGAGLARAPYAVRQGTVLGRAGRVTVRQDGETLWIGGRTVDVIEGTVRL